MSSPVLPPRQRLAAAGMWPVVGERAPRASAAPWRVRVTGLVARPREWSLEELAALGLEQREVDIHCVTRWSQLGARFGGTPLRAVLAACAPLPAARFVRFAARSARGHSTSLPLADALALDPLLASTRDDAPLAEEHGGPLRVVTPGRYFYKSLKWLETIELLAEDRLGYWEATAGYHNTADPWREERYAAPTLDRRATRAVLASRNFAERDLRGLWAEGFDLAGLNAAGASLRDARFDRACLRGACFDGANLSNARMVGADLRQASFRPLGARAADLEGVDLRGADLRGAVFEGVSLFGATLFATEGDEPELDMAPDHAATRVDETTRVDEATLATLAAAPEQQARLRAALGGARG